MAFTDDAGRRTRLWIEKEVYVTPADREAFMDMLVSRTVGILENEPIARSPNDLRAIDARCNFNAIVKTALMSRST